MDHKGDGVTKHSLVVTALKSTLQASSSCFIQLLISFVNFCTEVLYLYHITLSHVMRR